MDSRIVIALYKPHQGKARELEQLLARHVPTLRQLGLITDRLPIHARAEDGTYLEIFEWRSEQASSQAHEHPRVVALWEAMGGCCDLPRLASLAESQRQFPHFTPLALPAS